MTNGKLFFAINESEDRAVPEMTMVSMDVPKNRARSIINFLEHKLGPDIRIAEKEEQLIKIESN